MGSTHAKVTLAHARHVAIFRAASTSASYTSQNIDCSCKPDSNLVPNTSGSPQGPGIKRPTGRSGVLDPLLVLLQSVRALQSGAVAASPLAEHTWSTGHHMDLSKAEVVDAQLFVNTWCLHIQ